MEFNCPLCRTILVILCDPGHDLKEIRGRCPDCGAAFHFPGDSGEAVALTADRPLFDRLMDRSKN